MSDAPPPGDTLHLKVLAVRLMQQTQSNTCQTYGERHAICTWRRRSAFRANSEHEYRPALEALYEWG